jgi:bifunctional DNA-binding transcriptional regulator/antitoxin component of YhaV-PrlF toxin-antitoxin module
MGYNVKLQKVERPTNRSYYVNLPVVLAETLGFAKGDVLEWSVKDQATLLLRRIGSGTTAVKSRKKPKKIPTKA